MKAIVGIVVPRGSDGDFIDSEACPICEEVSASAENMFVFRLSHLFYRNYKQRDVANG